jgi:uncharacterized protein YndB with AHSA1/START domain
VAERASEPFVVVRTFAAPRALVFAALTQEEHLRHWMGPAGMVMSHCRVDLRPGGTFHYGLKAAGAPAGPVMWGKWTYREIVAPERLVVVVQFSDEQGGLSRHPPAANWPLHTLSITTLTEADGITTLRLDWRALDATEAEEQLFNSSHAGMQQGWSGTMAQLDAYLASAQAR